MKPVHLQGKTFHRRLGKDKNTFSYNVDYLLLDPSAIDESPALFSANKLNLMSFHTSDYGGPIGNGAGVPWVRKVLIDYGFHMEPEWKLLLLAQPRVLGTKFTPVSFWLVMDESENLRLVIAEVNNTFGERHAYICYHFDNSIVSPDDVIKAKKIFHVSPFQPVEGVYSFRFKVTKNEISIKIEYERKNGGIIATLQGVRQPLTNASIIRSILFRPFGSLRTLALIHFQAFRLWARGVRYHTKPNPPNSLISNEKI